MSNKLPVFSENKRKNYMTINLLYKTPALVLLKMLNLFILFLVCSAGREVKPEENLQKLFCSIFCRLLVKMSRQPQKPPQYQQHYSAERFREH